MQPSTLSEAVAAWSGPPPSTGSTTPACLIVGLGNCLLGDDGVGVHAVRQLAPQPPEGALLLEVGTDVFSAVPWLERVPRVLAIDALDAGQTPGTIYQCDSGEVSVERVRASLHELSLLAVLEFVDRTKRPAITVLGVQPAVIDYGLALSPALQEALPRVVQAARSVVLSWAKGKELGPHRPTPLG
jgi:hydrogenase maturation protease